jgi:hypothetical protein
MTKILEITNRTTDDEINNAILFEDMRGWAKEMRDDADVLPDDEVVLTMHEFDDNIFVLWDGYNSGMVNQVSGGIGNSLTLHPDEVDGPVAAAERWFNGE